MRRARNASRRSRRARTALPRPPRQKFILWAENGEEMAPSAVSHRAVVSHKKTPGSLLQPGVSSVVASTRLLARRRGAVGGLSSLCWPSPLTLARYGPFGCDAQHRSTDRPQLIHRNQTLRQRDCGQIRRSDCDARYSSGLRFCH